MPVQTQLQIRRDTAANWTSTNPTLASGEWGLETDTRQYKIGDGATAWNSLGYQLGPLLDEEIATDPNGAYFTGSGFNLYGVTGNYASTPDAAALDITGDIDIRVKVSMPDWTPGGTQRFIAKRNAAGQYSYTFSITATGNLAFDFSSDGTNVFGGSVVVSSVATGLADGSTKWLRTYLDVNNGAGSHEVYFFLSDDGTNWTQLGAGFQRPNIASIFNSTSSVEFGSQLLGTSSNLNGTLYRAQILNGIGGAGTTAFDANFETVPADSFAFTESSANAAAVTLTTTRYSFGLPNMTMTGTSTFAITANRTYYNLIRIVGKPITIKHLAFEVTSAPLSSVTKRLAIYASDANMQPIGGPLIETSAITIGTSGTGAYRIRVTPTVLKPGNYLLATNATPTGYIVRSYGQQSYVPNTLGANLRTIFYASETLSGGFPNPGTKWGVTSTSSTSNFSLFLLGWS